MWYKVIDNQLVPPPVNFVTPDGSTICNFNLSPSLMTQYGWTDWTQEEVDQWHKDHPTPPPAPRTTCTKYELITVLSQYFPELFSELKAAYASSPELQFYWNTVNELDRNNSDFQHFTEVLGVTEAQLDAIFAAINGQVPESSDSESSNA